MLKNQVLEELMKLDNLGTIQQLTNSAKLHLRQQDAAACLTELNKLQEYIESLRDIMTILAIFKYDKTRKKDQLNQDRYAQWLQGQTSSSRIYS